MIKVNRLVIYFLLSLVFEKEEIYKTSYFSFLFHWFPLMKGFSIKFMFIKLDENERLLKIFSDVKYLRFQQC